MNALSALGATSQVLEARHDPWWLRQAMPTSAQERGSGPDPTHGSNRPNSNRGIASTTKEP